jgi:hypothetical protein
MHSTEILEENIERQPFSKKLSGKAGAIKQLGNPNKDVQQYVEKYAALIEFDDSYQRLLESLEKYPQELSRSQVDQIHFFSQTVKELNDRLENLNYANPKDLNTVFQPFDQMIEQRGLLQDATFKNHRGVDIRFGKKYVDILIDQIKSFIEELTPQAEIDTSSIKEAQALANKIISQQEKYEAAAKTAENWIEREAAGISVSLDDVSSYFSTKSNQHKGFRNSYVWLLGAGIIGMIVFAILMYFVISEPDIQVGSALLRITSVAVLVYFMYLFVSIFTQERNFKETYAFKAVALKTMTELVKSFPEPNERATTLQNAIQVIFAEPTNKKQRIVHEKVVDGVIDVVKKKA